MEGGVLVELCDDWEVSMMLSPKSFPMSGIVRSCARLSLQQWAFRVLEHFIWSFWLVVVVTTMCGWVGRSSILFWMTFTLFNPHVSEFVLNLRCSYVSGYWYNHSRKAGLKKIWFRCLRFNGQHLAGFGRSEELWQITWAKAAESWPEAPVMVVWFKGCLSWQDLSFGALRFLKPLFLLPGQKGCSQRSLCWRVSKFCSRFSP